MDEKTNMNVNKTLASETKTFCFFSAQYLPKTGGVERFTFNLAKKLVSHGHQVIVVTSEYASLPENEKDGEGIEIIRMPSYQFMGGRLPLIKPNSRFKKIEKALNSRKIDCCIINTYFYPLSMYAARWTKKKKIPSVIINHGSAWLMTGNIILELFGQIYERLAVWFCKKNNGRFYGVSQACREWMNTFGVETEGIITNAVSVEEIYESIDADTDWRKELGLSAKSSLIAFVGRMIPEKGVEPMMEAMRFIREKIPECYLAMAGEGPLYDKYSQAVPEGVRLLGRQSYSSTLALMKQADIFCLPSRSEGFACTVLEAAALQCPIITTATGGSPQLLINGDYGLLIKDMDKKTIADACVFALENPQWRNRAASLARARLEENYTWDAAAQQLYEAFGIL